MADFWGPGLDAELAYRHERLFTALRRTPYGDAHDQRGGEHDDLSRDHAEPARRRSAPPPDGSRSGAARAPADECRAWVAAARIGGMARGSMSTPFVARAQQVDQLTLALQRAGVGEPATVLIGADAGVGKTRLLRHVAELADAAGARVVVAHCVDLGEIGLPYLPFAEALVPAATRSTPRRSTRSSPTVPRSPGCCPGPSGSGGAAGRPVEPAPAVRRAGRGARRGRPPGAPAPARARGPALGRRVQPRRAALPRLAAARPAPARRRQLPHRRPAPAAPVAARRRGAGPAPARRAARPVAVHRRRAARVHHRPERRPADGVARCAASSTAPRATRTSRRSCWRPAPRRTSCRGRSPTSCAPASSCSTRRSSAWPASRRRPGGGCPSRCCAPRSPRTGTRS